MGSPLIASAFVAPAVRAALTGIETCTNLLAVTVSAEDLKLLDVDAADIKLVYTVKDTAGVLILTGDLVKDTVFDADTLFTADLDFDAASSDPNTGAAANLIVEITVDDDIDLGATPDPAISAALGGTGPSDTGTLDKDDVTPAYAFFSFT